MSADIINLNQFRKAKQKDEKREKASQNRTRHGRTKAEKLTENRNRENTERLLAGKKVTDKSPDDDQESPA